MTCMTVWFDYLQIQFKNVFKQLCILRLNPSQLSSPSFAPAHWISAPLTLLYFSQRCCWARSSLAFSSSRMSGVCSVLPFSISRPCRRRWRVNYTTVFRLHNGGDSTMFKLPLISNLKQLKKEINSCNWCSPVEISSTCFMFYMDLWAGSCPYLSKVGDQRWNLPLRWSSVPCWCTMGKITCLDFMDGYRFSQSI